MEEKQAAFEGWAIVEMLGHRREIGYVTTEHYGGAARFRVDVPELVERDRALDRPEYLHTNIGYKALPRGTVVRRPAVPARSVLVGVQSIYALNPCTEEVAREAIESGINRPLILLSMPPVAQISAAKDIDVSDLSQDFEDRCDECGLKECDGYCNEETGGR